MADRRLSVPENVPGDFFVDNTCIDCDACRQLAPEVFGDSAGQSFVKVQPSTPELLRRSLQAVIACPTASIGSAHPGRAREVVGAFPLLLEDNVFYCGFHSPKSYGGSSYFVQHEGGNWLVDSPRYNEPLVRRMEELGGIRYIFLSHRDDVADAAKFAQRFGAQRVIHRDELSAQPGAEIVVDGDEPAEVVPGFLAIPTPGHTRGHMVLLHREFLFTGDHLWWNRERDSLSASRNYCWWSWPDQVRSLERLLAYRFRWVLPGHGERKLLTTEDMHCHLMALVARLKGR
jgi:glyoxylase-like metal-dependent hydrolase (beta-lactamase superfamily II)/ferredoxin